MSTAQPAQLVLFEGKRIEEAELSLGGKVALRPEDAFLAELSYGRPVTVTLTCGEQTYDLEAHVVARTFTFHQVKDEWIPLTKTRIALDKAEDE
jgi:hypothetical protein